MSAKTPKTDNRPTLPRTETQLSSDSSSSNKFSMSDIEINKSVSLSLNPAKEVTVTNGGHDSDQWTQVILASHWSMLFILASHFIGQYS